LLHLLDQILPLPKRFDQNEWFILLNITFGYVWIFFSPKKYPNVISLLAILFSVCMALIIDHAIAPPPLDLYDINDWKEYELFDVITYFIYTPYALLFVYLYDKFNPKGLYFTANIIIWSLFSVGFEWVAAKFHVFTYNNWSLLYSFSVYLVTTTLQLSFFRFILRYFNEKTDKSGVK
jgi:hypothetical protein